MRLAVFIAVALALAGLLAGAAPLPDLTNPKYQAVPLPTASTPILVDPVAAALASRLAAVNKGLGKLPVLPSLSAALAPTTAVKAESPAKVVLNAKGEFLHLIIWLGGCLRR
ncbi:hypothetical protein JCM3770_000040 [Rhodotorula araucariae]